MAKKKVTELVAGELSGFLGDNGYELYDIEFVKEAKNHVLRVYIDREQNDETNPIGTDDCEKVSRYLSRRLDELDPIESNYLLEVSSPGLERELVKEKDYQRYSGREVEIRLYRPSGGRKIFSGILKSRTDGNVIITDENGDEMRFPVGQIAKTKLKIVF